MHGWMDGSIDQGRTSKAAIKKLELIHNDEGETVKERMNE